ncbi:MAG: hypothetical protein ACREQM_16145, partial [Candidatus Dormibacteraceae bacterium]
MGDGAASGEHQAWRLFDRACRLMPQRDGEAIAAALSAELGERVTREQVDGGRAGTTNISADLLLAAYRLAGIEQRLVMEAGPQAVPPAAPARRRLGATPKLRVVEGGLAALLAAALLLVGAVSPRIALVLTDGHLHLPYVSQPQGGADLPTPGPSASAR